MKVVMVTVLSSADGGDGNEDVGEIEDVDDAEDMDDIEDADGTEDIDDNEVPDEDEDVADTEVAASLPLDPVINKEADPTPPVSATTLCVKLRKNSTSSPNGLGFLSA
ncbi:hypothetical protein P171DRAFT_428914 [Karstenula rhodostoma CBS 690.94]|uniref:Uncharacterized protein n=1 Tax=Karstenula rhodostoma CBS 690.94 TaxID=1392251 RepID=A0A9P4PRP1_9PLEO|nr:hypothetical protein P171DRAFT_428914 [Karstenula rhodostoma CBS 690.94]